MDTVTAIKYLRENPNTKYIWLSRSQWLKYRDGKNRTSLVVGNRPMAYVRPISWMIGIVTGHMKMLRSDSGFQQ